MADYPFIPHDFVRDNVFCFLCPALILNSQPSFSQDFARPNLTGLGKIHYDHGSWRKNGGNRACGGLQGLRQWRARLEACDLTVAAGEWLVLVGSSGSGKTTTLRLIAGLEKPSSGTIRIGARIVNQVPPSQRDVAMVFQRPALFPNKNVRANLAFGMRLQRGFWRRFSRDYRHREEDAVRDVAGYLRIEHLLDRRPGELSGGEQQRMALGRALIRRTAVGLLDEPLGHLDAPLREKLTAEFPLLRSRFPATMVIVTHDPVEALALGDRIAVLHNGRVLQVDRPEALLRKPADAFVGEFFQGAHSRARLPVGSASCKEAAVVQQPRESRNSTG